MTRKRSEPQQTPDRQSAAEAPAKYLELAANVAAAYLSNHRVATSDIPNLIRGIYASLSGANNDVAGASTQPAVPIKRSITNDFIICLEDGKRLRTLKRYLGTQYQMTPEQYRAKWGLPHDYPMVAPSYAEIRSQHAKRIGLGRIPHGSRRGRKRGAN